MNTLNKAIRYFLLSFMLVFVTVAFSQANNDEITSKNSKGKAELINFNKTKIKSDNNAVKDFFRKQYNTKEETDYIEIPNSATKQDKLDSKKYQQYYKGLKVEFGTQNVVSESGILKVTNGRHVDIQNLDIVPKISEKEALSFALKNIGAKEYMWEKPENEAYLKTEQNNSKATYYPKGELIVVEKDLFTDNSVARLAYKFEIVAAFPYDVLSIYIDSENGEVLYKISKIETVIGYADTRYSGQRTIETQQVTTSQYKLRDYTRGQGIETFNMNRLGNYTTATDFIDNDNNWTSAEFDNANKDNAALDAHWGTEKVYDYFLTKHNRNSIDNLGFKLKNYVHANLPLISPDYTSNDNAFWDGSKMTYGDGQYQFMPLTCIDVVGHEIAHGLCSYTAQLIYSGIESGPLNEGLSDIWGAMIEYYADPTKQTYLIGEEIKIGGGALRSMSNPKQYGNPDTYNGLYWYTGTSNSTRVHTNSGVMNHWFYILAEGKSSTNDIGNTYSVSGIGKEKAAKIVYRAETVYFNATTNYSNARTLTIQAANDLYGTNSVEAATVCQSWYAVGIGNSCIVPISINGNNEICSSTTNTTYTVPNLTSGEVVSWSLSSNLVKVSSTNSSIDVKPTNTTVSGVASITATVSGQSTTKNIWIGIPQITIQLVSDSNYADIYLIGDNGTDIYSQGITNTTWTKIASTNNGTAGGSGFEGSGNGPNFNWTATLKITATNSCGTTEIIEVVTCAAPIPCGEISYIISPSSENEYVIYSMVLPCDGLNTTKTESTLYNGKADLRVYDIQGNELIKSKTNTLNINELKSGIYIIKAKIDNQVITSKIMKP